MKNELGKKQLWSLWYTSPAFTWRGWWKQWQTPVRTADLHAYISMRDLPNERQEYIPQKVKLSLCLTKHHAMKA